MKKIQKIIAIILFTIQTFFAMEQPADIHNTSELNIIDAHRKEINKYKKGTDYYLSQHNINLVLLATTNAIIPKITCFCNNIKNAYDSKQYGYYQENIVNFTFRKNESIVKKINDPILGPIIQTSNNNFCLDTNTPLARAFKRALQKKIAAHTSEKEIISFAQQYLNDDNSLTKIWSNNACLHLNAIYAYDTLQTLSMLFNNLSFFLKKYELESSLGKLINQETDFIRTMINHYRQSEKKSLVCITKSHKIVNDNTDLINRLTSKHELLKTYYSDYMQEFQKDVIAYTATLKIPSIKQKNKSSAKKTKKNHHTKKKTVQKHKISPEKELIKKIEHKFLHFPAELERLLSDDTHNNILPEATHLSITMLSRQTPVTKNTPTIETSSPQDGPEVETIINTSNLTTSSSDEKSSENNTTITDFAETKENTPPLMYDDRVIQQYLSGDDYHCYSRLINEHLIKKGNKKQFTNRRSGHIDTQYVAFGEREYTKNGAQVTEPIAAVLCIGEDNKIYHNGIEKRQNNVYVKENIENHLYNGRFPTLATSMQLLSTSQQTIFPETDEHNSSIDVDNSFMTQITDRTKNRNIIYTFYNIS